MSFTPQYPPVLTETGDNTSEVLAKFNSEFQYIYLTLLSQLFSSALGHGHTGNGSDGPQLSTASLVDGAVTTGKIADSNVTTAKIADGAITAAKMADDYKTAILSAIYPVGAIYMSADSTSPATLFGGTWAQIKDTFLLSAGDTYGNGSTGGEATHTLTVEEMPSHNHYYTGNQNSGSQPGVQYMNNATGSQFATSSTGGGQAHNNMPPYLAVYMWKRTA